MFGRMFGKKKPVRERPDTTCKVCGVECLDESGVKRHMEWVHTGSKNPATEQANNPETREK